MPGIYLESTLAWVPRAISDFLTTMRRSAASHLEERIQCFALKEACQTLWTTLEEPANPTDFKDERIS